MSSQCCQDATQRCYEKNKYWGTCRDECDPGLEPNDPDAEPWTCRVLGINRAWASSIEQAKKTLSNLTVEDMVGSGCVRRMCKSKHTFRASVYMSLWSAAESQIVHLDGQAADTQMQVHDLTCEELFEHIKMLLQMRITGLSTDVVVHVDVKHILDVYTIWILSMWTEGNAEACLSRVMTL